MGRWCRRHPALAGLLGTVAILLLVIAVTSSILAVVISASRDDAIKSAGDLRTARDVAVQAQRRAEQLVAQQYVENGTRLLDRGDVTGAALWCAKALEQDQTESSRVETHRFRLTAMIRQCPRPALVLFHKANVSRAVWASDGSRFLTLDAAGRLQVWDAISGRAIGQELSDRNILGASFSNDGRQVIMPCRGPLTTGPDRSRVSEREIRTLDVSTGSLTTWPMRSDPAADVGFGGSWFSDHFRYVALPVRPGVVQVWDTSSGQPVSGYLEHEGLTFEYIGISADGQHLVTVNNLKSDNRTLPKLDVKLWNVEAGTSVTIWRGVERTYPQFTPDSSRLVCLHYPKVDVWDTSAGRLLESTILPPNASLSSFSRDARRLVLLKDPGAWFGDATTVDRANLCQTWNVRLGRADGPPFQVMGDGRSPFDTVLGMEKNRTAQLSPEGGRLLSVGLEGQPVVRHVLTGQPVAPSPRLDAPVESTRFSPDGKFIIVVTQDHFVRVWEEATGQPITPLLPHQDAVFLAELSPDGSRLLTVSGNTVRLWPLSGMSAGVVTFHTDTKGAKSPRLSRDGRRIVTVTDRPHKMTVRDTVTGRPIAEPILVEAVLDLSADGQRILLISGGQSTSECRLLDITTGQSNVLLNVAPAYRTTGQFSPDGRRVLTVWKPESQHETELRLWDTSTGRVLGSPIKLSFSVRPVFSNDGRRLILFDKTSVVLWNVESGTTVTIAVGPRADEAFMTPDGRRLITFGEGLKPNFESLTVWDGETGRELSRLDLSGFSLRGRHHEGSFGSPAAVTPDGRYVVLCGFGSGGNEAGIWDLQSKQSVARRLTDGSPVHITISPDGQRVATAGIRSARVWNLATGEPLTPPLVHGQPVAWMNFSPDGRHLITLSAQLTRDTLTTVADLRIWDTQTGQPLTPALRTLVNTSDLGSDHGTRPPVSEDGLTIALLPRIGTVQVHKLAPEPRSVAELLALCETLSGREVNSFGKLQPLATEKRQHRWELLQSNQPHELALLSEDLLAWHRSHIEPMSRSLKPTTAAAFGTLWHLDRLIGLGQASPEDFLQRGHAHAALGQWPKAIDDYDQATDAKIDGAIGQRGEAHAELAHWTEAVRDFSLAREDKALSSLSIGLMSDLALAQRAKGDIDGYRASCRLLLESVDQFHQRQGSLDFRSFVWPCLLEEKTLDGRKTLRKIVKLSASGFSVGPEPPFMPRAALLLREDQFADAIDALQFPVSRHTATTCDWFFLAIAQHKNGDKESAKKSLAEGLKRMAEAEIERTAETASIVQSWWRHRLAEQVLRREAEALLQGQSMPEK
jgi:WD40 repeat protein/tetratricopeptide (TPR) repeat protein